MKKNTRFLRSAFAGALALALAPLTAGAQETQIEFEEEERPDTLQIQAAGGIHNFVEGLETADNGVSWSARAILMPRSVLGAEVAYVGAANDLDTTLADQDAFLMTSIGEALLRTSVMELVGIRDIAWSPYLAAGAGFTNYDVMGDDAATVEFEGDTNLHVPAKAGVQASLTDNLVVDGHFTYRFEFDNQVAGDAADVQAWTAQAGLGWQF